LRERLSASIKAREALRRMARTSKLLMNNAVIFNRQKSLTFAC